jgi:hypothetical protein
VLEDRKLVDALEGVEAVPPKPASSPTPAPSPATESPTPAQTTTAPILDAGTVRLIGPDGNAVDVPEASKAVLLAAGFTEPEPEPANDGPADDNEVRLSIGGQQVSMLWSSAKALVASGTATLLGYGEPEPEATPEPEQPKVDLDAPYQDEAGLFHMRGPGGVTVQIPQEQVQGMLGAGFGHVLNRDMQGTADATAQQEVQQAVATDPTSLGGSDGASLDPSLTVQGEDGKWTHPALDKSYAAKGGVTQALNRLAKSSGDAPAAAPAPAANGATNGTASTKLEEAKSLLAQMPQISQDFKQLLDLFQEVAGKRNIVDFNESELDLLIFKLRDHQAAQAAG